MGTQASGPIDKGVLQTQTRYPGRRTDGAVLAVPPGAALALAVAAGPMLGTARVAGSLVTRCPHPAILAATGAPHADAMATTVGSTDLCGQKRGEGEKETSTEQVTAGDRVTLGYLRGFCK